VTATISPDELAARRLALSGTHNLRDVGGYATADGRQVRARTLLRSDSLHAVDQAGRTYLSDLGLRSSIDLRELDERTSAPSALPADVTLIEIPLFTRAAPGSLVGGDEEGIDRRTLTSLESVYELLVTTRGPVIVEVIRAITQPGALPAIVHCTAGKDRTGVIIALVLSAVGVPDEVIAADYAATAMFLGEEFRAQAVARNILAGHDQERLAKMLACEPQLILDTLAMVREQHGTVEAYLLAHGLTADELEALRAVLLEPAGTANGGDDA